MPDPYLASNDFPGDGSTTLRTVSFKGNRPDAESGTVPYLSASDVKAVQVTPATQDAPESEIALTVTYVGPNQFNITPACPVGTICRVYRATQDEYNLVDYQALQTVSEADLDLANRQTIFVVQEAHDLAQRAKADIQQATTVAYDANATSEEALATANASDANADLALSTAQSAVVTANAAFDSASDAVTTANEAKATADGVDAKAQSALDASAAATITANDAQTTANAIAGTADSALSQANSAVSIATTANNTANAANTTANGVDAKATTALANSAAAVTTANASQAAVAPYANIIGQQPDNLVLKGNFEDGSIGKWSASPTVVAVTHPQFSKAIKYTANSFDAAAAVNILTQTGEVFDFSADVNTTGMTVGQTTKVQIQFYDKAGGNLGYFNAFIVAQGLGWATYTGSVTTPANAVAGRLLTRTEPADGTGYSLWANIKCHRRTPTEMQLRTDVDGKQPLNAILTQFAAITPVTGFIPYAATGGATPTFQYIQTGLAGRLALRSATETLILSDAMPITKTVADYGWPTVNTVANMRALVLANMTGTNGVVKGAMLSGKAGGIFDWNASSTATDDGVMVIKLAATATGRLVRRMTGTVPHPYIWGAVGDNVADDTAAVQASVTWAENNGSSWFLPPGNFKCTSTITQIKPMLCAGAGQSASKLTFSGLGSTVDAWKVTPANNFANNGFMYQDFSILSATAGIGQYGMHVQLADDAAGVCFVADSFWNRMTIGDFGKEGIYWDNSVANVDGFFTSKINYCTVVNGILGLNVGDSVAFEHNKIYGKNCGIKMTGVGGAREMRIIDNNITTAGGTLALLSVEAPTIMDNQLEHPGYLSGYTGIYDTGVILFNCYKVNMVSNTVNPDNGAATAPTSPGLPSYALVLDGSTFAKFDNNEFRKGSVAHIAITGTAEDAEFGKSDRAYPTDGELVFADIATRTKYPSRMGYASWAIGTLAPGASSSINVTVTGARLGMRGTFAILADLAGGTPACRVSAANNIVCTITNNTAGSLVYGTVGVKAYAD